jgi:DNA recombination protein RmuC
MEPSNTALTQPLLVLFGQPLSAADLLVIAALAVLGLLVLCVVALWRSASARALAAADAADAARDADLRMAELLKTQAEMHGRMATMAEVFGARQSELNQSIQSRLDGMTQRLGTTMTEQTRQSLAKDVVGLQAILSNKQTRGAFGQSRMEAIVADGLPMGAYAFQATLSNNARPDCVVHMPNGQPALVIDAKFPLEAWNAIRAAETPEATKQASQQFRRDMEVHIRDISEKYLITGETQDTAFLFVPSESIFAEIHENFEGLIHKAQRSRVVIVSPSLLMLSIQVIQAILKDARMREQAHLIQGEVVRLMEDLGRLDQRVRNLQTHFGQTQKDIEQIVTSTDKLSKRGQRIEAMEFEAAPTAEKRQAERVEGGRSRGADNRTGSLKLRVIDEG